MKYLALTFTILGGFLLMLSVGSIVQVFTDSMQIPIVVRGTLEYEDAIWRLAGHDFAPLIFLCISYPLFTFSYAQYHKLKRKEKGGITLTSPKVQSPFILYLRSFQADDETKNTVSFMRDYRSEEELLIETLSDIAPAYAIGNPLDKDLPHGATRIYVNDPMWKQTVRELAQKAELVVLRLGKTDNFWWEVEMALQSLPLSKLVFMIPWSKTFDNVTSFYKIALANGVDISKLKVAIDKKSRGSISSIIWFDDDNNPKVENVRVPRFTSFVLSYDNLLRNALIGIRTRYGLSTKKRIGFRWARVVQTLLFLYLIFVFGSRFLGHYASLKYQTPYELNEECVKSEAFVDKYSADINGTNLFYSIVEATKGRFALTDEEYLQLLNIEDIALSKASLGEDQSVSENLINGLLLIKKYCPEYYDQYVMILAKAGKYSVENEKYINELIQGYKSGIDSLPQWVYDFYNSHDENNASFDSEWLSVVNEHINDDEIVFVLKVLCSQTINL